MTTNSDIIGQFTLKSKFMFGKAQLKEMQRPFILSRGFIQSSDGIKVVKISGLHTSEAITQGIGLYLAELLNANLYD